MLYVSEELHSAFMGDSRQIRARVTIGNRVFDNDNITSLSLDYGSMDGANFSIGATVASSLKLTFSELVENLEELDEIVVEIGAVLPDETIEYVPMGTFVINEEVNMDRNSNKTSLEAMDKMIMLGGMYESNLSGNAPIREIALDIANKAGVEVADTFDRLRSDSIRVPEGYTYREAIGLIAQFESGFATFNRDGKLEVRKLVDPEFRLTPENYVSKGLVKNEVFFRLNGIRCQVGDGEEDVLQAGSSAGNQITIRNSSMTQTHLNRIFQELSTLNYYPFTLNWYGNPALEAGDWIEIEDLQGNRFKSPNLSYTLEFNGGLTAQSQAETTSSNEVVYQYRSPLQQQIEWINARLDATGGNHIYDDITEPTNPKEGDLWFKPNGPDIELWKYTRLENGLLEWVLQISTTDNEELLEAIEENKRLVEEAQAAAEEAKQAGEAAKVVGEAASQAALEAKAVGEQAKLAGEQASEAAQEALQAGQQAQSKADTASNQAQNALSEAGKANNQINQAISEAGFSSLAQINADLRGRSTTAQNRANQAYSDAASAITQAQQAIAKFGQLEGTIAEMEIEIDELDNSITGIFTEINHDEHGLSVLSNRVTVNAQGLQSVQQAINHSETGLIALRNEQINQAGLISSKVSMTEVEGAIDGIDIGSTNLLLNTDFKRPINELSNLYWNFRGSTEGSIIENNRYSKNNVLKIDFEGSFNGSGADAYLDITRAITEDLSGQQITLVFYIKSENGSTFRLRTGGNGFNLVGGNLTESTTTTTTTYQRYERTWTVNAYQPQDRGGFIFWTAGQDTVYISDIMVVIGNKAGTWQKAQSELATEYQVSVLETNWTQTAEGFEQSILQINSDLDGKASLQAFNTLSSTVDGNVTRIGNAEGRINSVESTANGTQQIVSGANGLVTQVSTLSSGFDVLVTDFNNLDPAGRNLLLNTLEPYEFRNTSANTSGADVTVETNRFWATSNGSRMAQGSFFTSKGFTQDTELTVSGIIEIFKNDGSAPSVSDFPTNFSVSGIRFAGSGTSWRHFLTVTRSQMDGTTWKWRRTNTFILGALDGNPNVGHWDARVRHNLLPAGYGYRIIEPHLGEGNVSSTYSPAPEEIATQSQLSVLNDNINLRVARNDVVNQINISNESILIAGNKIHITGQTTINSAVIQTGHIANAAINNAKIASLAVATANIRDSAITNAKIANLAVETAKIANTAITNAKIGDAAITEAKIFNLAVTTGKIANAAITSAKIGTAAIGTAHIGDGVITNAKIANATIQGAKIQDATISSAKIITLDASKITTGYMSANRIQAGTIEGALSNWNLNTGIWTSYQQDGGSNVNYVQIGNGTLDSVNTQEGKTFSLRAGALSGIDQAPGASRRDVVTFDGTGIIGSKSGTSTNFTRKLEFTDEGMRIFGISGSGTQANTSLILLGGGSGSHQYINFDDGTSTSMESRARIEHWSSNFNLLHPNGSRVRIYNRDRSTDSGIFEAFSIQTRHSNGNSIELFQNRVQTPRSGTRDMYLSPNGQGKVRVANINHDYYPIRAIDFENASSRELKTNIEKFTGDALEVINSLKVMEYEMKKNVREGVYDKQLGLISEDSPVVASMDGESILSYKVDAYLIKAVQELDSHQNELKGKVLSLEAHVKGKIEAELQRAHARIDFLENKIKQLEEAA